MPQLLHATSTTLRSVIIGALVLAALCIGASIWLVYLGAISDMTFTLFGQTFKSTSVGVAGLFIGAVTFVRIIRRALSTIDKVVDAETAVALSNKRWMRR